MMNNLGKKILYANPISLVSANRMVPYLKAIIRSTDEKYLELKRVEREINDMLIKPSPNKDYLDKLQGKCDEMYRLLDLINDAVDEVSDNLMGDYTDVGRGIISFMGRRRGQKVLLAYHRGQEEITAWRKIGDSIMHLEPIMEKNEFR